MKKNKKVLFVATVDSHILQFHIPYLKWFKEHGYEVHVATNGDEKIPYCDKKHKICVERRPIKINNLKAIIQLRRLINEDKFDIIHCHTPMGSVVTRIAAQKARKKYGTKVIYTAHGFHFFKGAPVRNWIIFYPVEKWLSKYTDCLITINQEDYDLAKNKFWCKNVKFVQGVGVDKNKFNFAMSEEEKNKIRKELGIDKKDFVIIYPAELSKRKNQGMLLDIIKELKDDGYNNVKLLLPGLDSINGEYQRYAERLEIKDEVKFLGYRNDIPKLMKISNLAVSAAKQEGLPVNLIEAMMSNLPIVATNCRGNRDLIGDCVDIDDKEKFKEKIINNIKNNLTKNYDKDKYELSNIVDEMEKIYIEMQK